MAHQDDKRILEGLSDFDWETALEEWDKSAAPNEPEASKPVAASPPVSASPASSSAPVAISSAPPQARGGLSQLFARDSAPPRRPSGVPDPATLPRLEDEDDASAHSEQTRVAAPFSSIQREVEDFLASAREAEDRRASMPPPATHTSAPPSWADEDEDQDSKVTAFATREQLESIDEETSLRPAISLPPTSAPPISLARPAPPPIPVAAPPASLPPPSSLPRRSSLPPPLPTSEPVDARRASAPPLPSYEPLDGRRPSASAPPPLPRLIEDEEEDDDDLPAPPKPKPAAPAREVNAFLGSERPAPAWLDAEAQEAHRERAEWLEEEARASEDPVVQARGLLAVSELRALIGDHAQAQALAAEARGLAPSLALAWRQARQLDVLDADGLVEALDAEVPHAPTPAAQAHAALLAGDVLRAEGELEGAVERWTRAASADPADRRGELLRAVTAIGRGEPQAPTASLSGDGTLARGVNTALRLRGAERAGAPIVHVPINDGLRRARLAWGTAEIAGVVQAIAAVAEDPALKNAAHWLTAAVGAVHPTTRRQAAGLLAALVSDGEAAARRPLAARGFELGEPSFVTTAREGDTTLSGAEQAVLARLLDKDALPPGGALADETLAPLDDALHARSASGPTGERSRSNIVSGEPRTRHETTLGRLLAQKADVTAIDAALATIGEPRSPSVAGVAIEAAARAARWDEIGTTLGALPSDDERSFARHVAAALFAERAGKTSQAKVAWQDAIAAGATGDGMARASIEEGEGSEQALARALLQVAEAMPQGPAAAILRLEAVARGALDEEETKAALEEAHRAAEQLPIASYLAEFAGRRNGDVEEVLRWIQERRTNASDAFEDALDAVREAFLVADRDPEIASARLEQAHLARPDDAALRELYERLATEPPTDRGAWREKRAEAASGATRAMLFTEAALEYERAGDAAAALRTARAAAQAGDRGFSTIVERRAEIASGDVTRLTEELIEIAKTADDEATRRDAYERLADVDLVGRKDAAAALLWHQAILEGTPTHRASLRYVEHALTSEGRDEELEPIFEQIALALDGTGGGEVTGHAQLAARLRLRRFAAQGAFVPGALGGPSNWERTLELAKLAKLAAAQPEPSLWAIRALNGHARLAKDDETFLSTTLSLLERTQRPSERATLALRASEAAARLENHDEARRLLELAASEDPGDVVTWGLLAEVRQMRGELRLGAEACESLARASVVAEHQLLAWYEAARLWLDELDDAERGMSALEQCAEIDVGHADVAARLSALYAARNLDAELARLLERRLSKIDDEGERVALEVELARALLEMGEIAKAKEALESALGKQPDHTTALDAMADLCTREGDWAGAEHAWVRLARLLPSAEEQRVIYERLGEIYAVHTVNLSRAEVAYKEVLKRAPEGTVDAPTLEKLVDIYRRQGDAPNAAAIQQDLVAASDEPDVRLSRLIALAQIHETVARDARRAEQTFEAARKEFPTSVLALRAMAEFYLRQRQMPAMQILLDRAAGDARRAFAAGRFVPALFEVLHAAYELRGRQDGARVVAATLAAVTGPASGRPAPIAGGEARAADPRLDDVLAPELISPALRMLLSRAGDALDAVSAVDLRALRAVPLPPGSPLAHTVGAIATVVGLGALQIYVSPQLGRVAIPLASNPPVLLVGEPLVGAPEERVRAFVVMRALKMILSQASFLLRSAAPDVANHVAALFTTFNPTFTPQRVDLAKVHELARRIGPALPRNIDPTVGVIALEAAGNVGPDAIQLGPMTAAWANRVALLAVGDPSAALEGIAWAHGESGVPTDVEARASWIADNAEARELMTFSVTDAFAEARTRLGLDR